MAKDSTHEPGGYRKTLTKLQVELVKLQRQIIADRERVLVIVEGRDAAGKDGAIKHVVEHLSPRETRVVALVRLPIASATPGISNATSRICRRRAKWCSSIAAGTTAPASSR